MKLKTVLTALAGAAIIAIPVAYAAGLFQTLPIIGGAAYCASSNVVGPAQTGITGQGGGTAGANVTTGNTICGQTVPAGPPALTGAEVVPVDLYTPGTAVQAGGPATAVLPVTALGQGYGTTQIFTTTGTTASLPVANGVSNLVISVGGTATTITSLVLPPNPIQNQQFCVRNVSTVLPAITGTVVGTTGQSIVGTPMTTLGVQTSTGAATFVQTEECFVYNVANTTWYRVL
jgi:hypothetical protein